MIIFDELVTVWSFAKKISGFYYKTFTESVCQSAVLQVKHKPDLSLNYIYNNIFFLRNEKVRYF